MRLLSLQSPRQVIYSFAPCYTSFLLQIMRSSPDGLTAVISLKPAAKAADPSSSGRKMRSLSLQVGVVRT